MTMNAPRNTNLILKEESYNIIGSCMKVHTQFGSGFLESVHSEALEMEFKRADIPYEREKKLPVYYGDELLNKYFRVDFVCYNSIIIELKVTKYLIDSDRQQTLNNMKATKFKLGLLINFGTPSLAYKRILN